jgi:hypothetical protein
MTCHSSVICIHLKVQCAHVALQVYFIPLFDFPALNRHYILDVMRVTPRDAIYIGLQHRFCVLRPELVASIVEVSLPHSFCVVIRNTLCLTRT